MSVDKNRSEIVQSFKNLLKKADEMAIEKKNRNLGHNNELIKQNQVKVNKNLANDNINNLQDFNRLGIKSIKRIAGSSFAKKNIIKTKDFLVMEKELEIKVINILNRHIHYWLKKEMPKYVKNKLREHVDGILSHLYK